MNQEVVKWGWTAASLAEGNTCVYLLESLHQEAE